MRSGKASARPRLQSKQWLFHDYGLDDFRAGAPKAEKMKLSDDKPPAKYIQIAQPPIMNNEESIQKEETARAGYLGLTKKAKNAGTKLNKHQAVFSKQLPRSEQRKDEIHDAEQHLKAHPLALHPHLLKAVPIDLVDNVSHLLESDLIFRQDEMSGIELDTPIESMENTPKSSDNKLTETGTEAAPQTAASAATKRYKWLIRDDDKKKPVKTARELEEEESARRLDEVTADFAKWANDLSDATPNVDPNTIKSLFASGYETKPALTVPIQVYELSSLPSELKISDNDPASAGGESRESKSADPEKLPAVLDVENSNKASDFSDKKPYGAWYIKPQAWNSHYKAPKQDPDEILLERATDPNNIVNNAIKTEISDPNLAAIEKVRMKRELQEAQKASKGMKESEGDTEGELAQLHSARAFREYLESQPDLKQPDFMQKIIQIQDEM